MEWVSVVIPVFNREGLVERALESVCAQSYRPIHLIVVDNNSTDNSFKVVSDWAEIHNLPDFKVTVLQETKPGAAAARALGAQHSTSDKIMFLDSDDALRPEIVEKGVEKFRQASSDTDIVYWRVKRHFLGGTIRESRHVAPSDILEGHIIHASLCSVAYMVRRHLLEDAGGWRPEIRFWDDWELGIRLIMKARRVAAIPDTGCDVYCQENSITGVDYSSRKGEWEKTIDAVEKSVVSSRSSLTDYIIGWLDYRRVILAAHYKKEGDKKAGEALREKTLSNPRLNLRQRLALRLIYHYTSRGGRGGYYLYRFLRRTDLAADALASPEEDD